MMYVLSILWGALAGYVSGWFMYNASAGSKKDRLRAALVWGISAGILSCLSSIGA